MIFPVSLGQGKRLFGNGTPVGQLAMIDHSVTAKGTVIAKYRPGGSLPPYPPGAPDPTPSARERERRKRMEAGLW